jgi:transcriptional regulator with XRE-family HTH domain
LSYPAATHATKRFVTLGEPSPNPQIDDLVGMLEAGDATFREVLRRYRVATGLTQAALAERAGLSVQAIQKLERGATQPYCNTPRRLAAALQLSADHLAPFEAAVLPVRRHGTTWRAASDAAPRHNLPAR